MKKGQKANMPLVDRILADCIPEPTSGCWLWIGCIVGGWGGYGHLNIKGKMVKAHRASWEVFRGTIPHGLSVLHKCDVPACINPDHLFLGTDAENAADRDRKKRTFRRLTDEQIEEIKLSAESQYVIALKYSIDQSTVSLIKNGKRKCYVA